MFDVLVQFDLFGKFIHISVDQDTDISASLCLIQKFCMGSLTSSDYRCKKLDLGPLRQGHDMVYHLVYGLFLDLLAALRTMWDSDSCIQKTEVIVDLSYCSYGRSRVSVCRFLINGDCRRQSLDRLHVWFLHLSQKLSRIRRQRLHIASLSFRINGIKSQRRLAGTTDSCQYYKFISWDIYAQILEVIYIRTPNPDKFLLSCMSRHNFLCSSAFSLYLICTVSL